MPRSLQLRTSFAVAFIIIFAMLGQPVSVEGIIYATVFAVVGTIFQGLGLFVIRRVWLRNTNVDELLASPRVTRPGCSLRRPRWRRV